MPTASTGSCSDPTAGSVVQVSGHSIRQRIGAALTAFALTAKYGAQKTLANSQYRRRSGWLPYAELAAGCGFLAIVIYAIQSFNYLAIPFLLLFVGGYFWAGVTTLWEEYQGKLAFERARALASPQAQAAKA